MSVSGQEKIYKSFLMGGFECSTHRIRSGRRLDMIAETAHDRFAEADYARLQDIGLGAARDGLRWHLIERERGRYDFDSLMLQVRAVRRTGIQIVWDLFHYGYPEDLDILSAEFVERFAGFSRAAAEFLRDELGSPIHFCPVNEISFFSWAAGRAGIFCPYKKRSAAAIKKQLVRAAIASMMPSSKLTRLRDGSSPSRRSTWCPVRTHRRQDEAAENYRVAQFEGYDMLSGRLFPELGGQPRYLDVLGLNYYIHNQWTYPSRRPLSQNHPLYRPPHHIFNEIYQRYQRPMIIAETGIEDDRRAGWFGYVAGEVQAARQFGVPLVGLCLYPIVNHPGWEDNRHCHNGLWDYADGEGNREAHAPLLAAVRSSGIDQVVPLIDASAG